MESFKPKKIEKNIADETKERKTSFQKVKDAWDGAKKYLKKAAIGAAIMGALYACGDNATSGANKIEDAGNADVMVVKDTGGSEDVPQLKEWEKPENYTEVCGPTTIKGINFCSDDKLCKICNLTLADIWNMGGEYREAINNGNISYVLFSNVKNEKYSNMLVIPINQYANNEYAVNNMFILNTRFYPYGYCDMDLSNLNGMGAPEKIIVVGVTEIPTKDITGQGVNMVFVMCNMGVIGEYSTQINGDWKIYTGNTFIRAIAMPEELYNALYGNK
ncbi:MAG: hypothetical protein QXS93_04160 [Candidatus Micrarchaeia archaeon]